MLETSILNQNSCRHAHNSVAVTTARSCFGYNDNFFFMVKWSGFTLSKLFFILQVNTVIFDDTFLHFSWRHFLVTGTFCLPILTDSAFSRMLVYSFSACWYNSFTVEELMWRDLCPLFLIEKLIQCLQGHTYPPCKTQLVVMLFSLIFPSPPPFKRSDQQLLTLYFNFKILWA